MVWIALYALFVALCLTFVAANNVADLRQDAHDRARATRQRPTGTRDIGGWPRRARLR
jgi:hypothetical protein